ncbi:MAG: FliA/WhiG family RNA polymerase sigma factor [Gemmatimonadaceae bacterium]|nr:FliA/WhiG family RNA polymerase sigma factor [Gemmatimonadaceae bacterium]
MSGMTLWQAFSAGDLAARAELLAEHISLVHHVSRQIHRRVSSDVELDELISAGTMGLIEALDRFEPTRGLAFSTFAVPRVRGAILDELRRIDHVPSSMRRRTRTLTAARESLRHELGREPVGEEVAEALGVGLPALWKLEAEAEGTMRVTLDGMGSEDGDDTPHAQAMSAEDNNSVEERITLDQETAILRETILRLSQQERTVLTLYYFEELKLHEIAAVLEVTESRVSQIRQKAVVKLRAELSSLRSLVA